jgi:hypothetical protein
MVISSMIKTLRQYCRCICIWQCCTTFQDFDPDFINTPGLENTSPATTPPAQLNQQFNRHQTYFNFVKGPPKSKQITDINSQTSSKASSTQSKDSSVARSINQKVDELEHLLSKA